MEARLKKIMDLVSAYDNNSKYVEMIPAAYSFAFKAHKNQKRDSGEPYITHPLAVAEILAELKMDAKTIITGLLHDTIEDTNVKLSDIEKKFSIKIAELVDGVTKFSKIPSITAGQNQAENLRKFLLAISKDIRVLIVKLADRLHNMRTIEHKSQEKRVKKAKETIEIYVPLAERIGMRNLKNELEDICFGEVYPEIKNSIVSRLQMLENLDPLIIDKIKSELVAKLKDSGIEARILGRVKTPYSIWMKMKRKNIVFEQLSDVMAFRIIVQTDDDCYNTLGILHRKYHAINGSFKDYISTPKENGYKSLHTIIKGPCEQKIEVQIRTEDMHEICEYGFSSNKSVAHWAYKSSDYDSKMLNWVSELLDLLNHTSSTEEFLEKANMEIYGDQVFCFTPKGKVIALPKGASAIDFAYAVHSDIGNKCVGAKINGRIAPLRTILENGDQVEIIVDSNKEISSQDSHKPLPSWEKFVVTPKAINEIRRVIKNEKRNDYRKMGYHIIAQTFKEIGLERDQKNIEEATRKFGKMSEDEFLFAVGKGEINRKELIKKLQPNFKISSNKPKINKGKQHAENVKTVKNDLSDQQIIITDTHSLIRGVAKDVAIRFATCCHPIPGDKIVGIKQPNNGVMIHISDCESIHIYSEYPEQWVEVAWEKANISRNFFVASITAIIQNQPGSLAALAQEPAKHGANIINFRPVNRSIDFFDVLMDVEVRGISQLNTIVAALRAKDCIHKIDRYIKR